MLNKLFKKNDPAPENATPVVAPETKADKVDKALWQSKLDAVMGDDAALLALARETPVLAIKLAAANAIQSEDTLKEAEREFRQHDRRVHRDLKQRLETLVATREAHEKADVLIASAKSLLNEETIPANRLVELDREWHAIDMTLVDDARIAAYRDAESAISQLLRSRGDKQVAGKRWLANAEEVEQHLRTECLMVANGTGDRAKLGGFHDRALALVTDAFDDPIDESAINRDMTHRKGVLNTLIVLARVIDVRLNFLHTLSTSDATPTADAHTEEGSLGSLNARWQALPPVTDSDVALALNARFDAWQRLQHQTRDAQHAATEKMSAEQKKAALAAQKQVLTDAIAKAEASLAAGNVIDTTAELAGIDELLKSAASDKNADKNTGRSADKKQQAQIEQLRAEVTRLRGWQQWGGGRVRDDLVLEAEALAKSSSDEKLALKKHTDAIENLRERWKELDKLGGATNRGLWLRFDAALKTAHLPVAANIAKLNAARQENLQKRNALIAELDKFPLQGTAAPSAAAPATTLDSAAESNTDASQSPAPTPTPAAPTPAHTPTDWKAVARALDHFQTEWRKLGPVEHTVPHKVKDALLKRMHDSEARLETPLADARRVEALKREKIIARAKALTAASAPHAPAAAGAPDARRHDTKRHDVTDKAKDLQNEWQHQAKGLPLARNVENKLWAEFKAAIDAVYSQRNAEFAARDASLSAHQQEREELIARLAGLQEDTPPAEIRKTVSEVDGLWRKAGEAPRNVAAKLDAKFRQARDRAQQLTASSQQRGWQKTCDALDQHRALLRQMEAASTGDAAETELAWSQLPALPKTWKAALDKRFQAVLAKQAPKNVSVDEPLLKLEAAMDLESPAQFKAARMEMKLRAMKNAIEARQAVTVSNADIERWFAEVLAAGTLDTGSESRFNVVLCAVRKKPLANG